MKSAQREIDHLLSRDVSIQKDLRRQILNLRALAKYFIKEHGLLYSTDAVISAIRRYELEKTSPLESPEIKKMFSQMGISTKDNVARLVLKDNAFESICRDYLQQKMLKENFRLIKSKEIITLIVSQKELDKKLSLFKPSDILRFQKNLSEIRLQFPKDVGKIKGIMARIAGELALREVNIEEIIYSTPDLLLYIDSGQILEAHQSLIELKKS